MHTKSCRGLSFTVRCFNLKWYLWHLNFYRRTRTRAIGNLSVCVLALAAIKRRDCINSGQAAHLLILIRLCLQIDSANAIPRNMTKSFQMWTSIQRKREEARWRSERRGDDENRRNARWMRVLPKNEMTANTKRDRRWQSKWDATKYRRRGNNNNDIYAPKRELKNSSSPIGCCVFWNQDWNIFKRET